MPRRNNRIRSGFDKRRWLAAQADVEPTYQDMAKDLVERGLASPLILGPLPPATRPPWGGTVPGPNRRTAGGRSEESVRFRRSAAPYTPHAHHTERTTR